MYIVKDPPSIPVFKYKLLQSLTPVGRQCDKRHSSWLHKPASRKSIIEPMTREDINKLAAIFCIKEASLNVCFNPVSCHEAYEGFVADLAKSGFIFLAANDDDDRD